MKKHTRDAACFSFLACFLTMMNLPAVAQKPHSDSPVVPYDFSTVRAYIQKTIGDKQLPSVSVAVAKNGKIIWEQAFGWADREKMIPATPDTIYALASLTKPYTSTGVMELVEQHKIDLDRPINEYLGSAPLTAIVGDASGATVRRVLCHTSGLPIHSVNLLGNGDQIPSMADTIRRYGALVNSPGEYFEYSNLGFGALGYMTSLVSQLDWKDYMRDKVFRVFSASLRNPDTKATSDSRTISAKSGCTSKTGNPCHLRRHSRRHG